MTSAIGAHIAVAANSAKLARPLPLFPIVLTCLALIIHCLHPPYALALAAFAPLSSPGEVLQAIGIPLIGSATGSARRPPRAAIEEFGP